MIPKTSKNSKETKIILTDDDVLFCLKHLKNSFLEVFPIKSNLCSREQSSLGKRLSSGRIISFISFISVGLIICLDGIDLCEVIYFCGICETFICLDGIDLCEVIYFSGICAICETFICLDGIDLCEY